MEALGFCAHRRVYIAWRKGTPTRGELEVCVFAGIGIPIPAKRRVYHIFSEKPPKSLQCKAFTGRIAQFDDNLPIYRFHHFPLWMEYIFRGWYTIPENEGDTTFSTKNCRSRCNAKLLREGQLNLTIFSLYIDFITFRFEWSTSFGDDIPSPKMKGIPHFQQKVYESVAAQRFYTEKVLPEIIL